MPLALHRDGLDAEVSWTVPGQPGCVLIGTPGWTTGAVLTLTEGQQVKKTETERQLKRKTHRAGPCRRTGSPTARLPFGATPSGSASTTSRGPSARATSPW
ncbi:hypothetical protein FOCC_FOCC006290 [Frankliniella occidentalis]|nr:hypothetical protein FOCC_FOCC006290 [Frankliniella occidentalis]